MKLSKKSVENERDKWLKSGYKLPEFDIDKMRERTRKEPSWVHFGAGNIFRGVSRRAVPKAVKPRGDRQRHNRGGGI